MERRNSHRFDGKFSKYKTKDCGEECPHYQFIFIPGRDNSHPCYVNGDEDDISEERCNYGAFWKHLTPREEPKHCEYFRNKAIKITK